MRSGQRLRPRTAVKSTAAVSVPSSAKVSTRLSSPAMTMTAAAVRPRQSSRAVRASRRISASIGDAPMQRVVRDGENRPQRPAIALIELGRDGGRGFVRGEHFGEAANRLKRLFCVVVGGAGFWHGRLHKIEGKKLQARFRALGTPYGGARTRIALAPWRARVPMAG